MWRDFGQRGHRPRLTRSNGHDLQYENRSDRAKAEDVFPQDRAHEMRLLRGRIDVSPEAHCIRDRAGRGETDRTEYEDEDENENERECRAPPRIVVLRGLDASATIVVDMAATTSRFIGRAAVVTRA
jgi:hypothetical protein